jgi:hypothetical protein
MLNRPGALLVAVVAPDVAGAELPPPIPEKSEEPGAVVVGVGAPAAVLVAPLVAGVLLDAGAAGLPMLNMELPPGFAPVLEPAFENKPELGAAEDVGAALLPPKVKEAMVAGGWEDAGAAPRPKAGGLLAGVEEGVALAGANMDGFGVDCPCAPAVSAWAPPPKRPEGAEDAGGAPLSAPAAVSLFPPNNPDPGAELPRGLPAAAPPKRAGLDADEDVAGFAPKSVGAAPPAWLLCPPNSVEAACAPAFACVFGAPKSDEPVCVFAPAWLF